jgi:uncharacterized membrane protein YeaQ/YmgE (transglycosylase-associated protein family)
VLGLVLTLAMVGFIAGALGRLIVPGRRIKRVVVGSVLGFVGVLEGGFARYLLFHKESAGEFPLGRRPSCGPVRSQQPITLSVQGGGGAGPDVISSWATHVP